MARWNKTRKQFALFKEKYPHILFYAQRNGYFDNITCVTWLKDTICNFARSHDHLLCLDNLAGHTSPEFRHAAWSASPKVWLLYTPADCTDACAVTDDGLGQAFKRHMRKSFVKHFNANMDLWQGSKSERLSEAGRRSLYAEWLHQSTLSFYSYNNVTREAGFQVVTRTFKRCGMANSIFGRDDSRIRINGWNEPIIL